MSDSTLADLRACYERGEMPRDDYWRRGQDELRRLRERTPLAPGGPVVRISAEGGDLVMELRDGRRLLWDPGDLRTAPNMLLLHGTYESREGEVLRQLASANSVVLDVGANVGWYATMLARQLIAGGRVFAFEPVPRTFRTLERNVALNDMGSRVTLLPVGLAEERKSVEFFVPERTGSVAASRRQLFADEANERVTVRLERLDTVAPALGLERLDLIKADVEGGELDLLRGGVETVRRFRPALFVELLRKWSAAHGYHPDDVLRLLGAEGYRCWAVGADALEPRTTIEGCESTNFVFLHAEAHRPLAQRLGVA